MTVEYTVYDRRNGQECGKSYHPDESAKSENEAIRLALPAGERQFAEVSTRHLTADAARPYVGVPNR